MTAVDRYYDGVVIMINRVVDIDYIDPQDITVNNVCELIDKYFMLFWDNIFPDGYDYNTLSRTVRTTTYKSCMRYICDNLFKTNDLIKNHASILNTDNIELLTVICDKYLSICDLYNKQLGLMGYALLIGYDFNIVQSWGDNVTSPLFKIHKAIRDHLRDSSEDSLKDSDIGRIAVANNSSEVGLNYGYQAAIQQHIASAPRLESIAERYGNRPQIGDN